MVLADAHIAVRVHYRIEHAGPAGNDLTLGSRCPRLGPLQHRLNNGTVPSFFARLPKPADILVEQPILLKAGTLEGWIFPIATNHRQIVMVHLRATVKEVRRQAPYLIHVHVGCRGDGVDPQTRVTLLQLRKGIVGLHRLVERARRTAEFVVKLA